LARLVPDNLLKVWAAKLLALWTIDPFCFAGASNV